MASSEIASIFAPLIFLVVMEICSIARDLDLTEIATAGHPPFFVGLFYVLHSKQRFVRIPQLGRFNFIHGANLAIVMLGFALMMENTTGFTRWVVLGLTWIVWTLLPLFEVDEYTTVLRQGIRPRSFYHHALVSTVAAATLYFFAALCALVSVPAPTRESAVWLVAISLVFYYVALLGFLRLLEDELEAANEDGAAASARAPESG